MELLTVSLSYENCFLVWPLLVSVLFVELFYMYLFVAIANVTDSVNHIFFLPGVCPSLFNVWAATHVLKFSSGNVPLNFVWLSHDALLLTINVLIVFFSFIILILCELQHLFLFSEWNCPTLLCLNFTQMLCVSSPLSLCECHTWFFLSEYLTNILVSPLLLSEHSTLFPFRSWLTHSRSHLVCTATSHFFS